MPRQYQSLLEDIRIAAASIQANATNISFEEFAGDENRVKAVLYDLSVIGEACRNVPDEIREKAPKLNGEKLLACVTLLLMFIGLSSWQKYGTLFKKTFLNSTGKLIY